MSALGENARSSPPRKRAAVAVLVVACGVIAAGCSSDAGAPTLGEPAGKGGVATHAGSGGAGAPSSSSGRGGATNGGSAAQNTGAGAGGSAGASATSGAAGVAGTTSAMAGSAGTNGAGGTAGTSVDGGRGGMGGASAGRAGSGGRDGMGAAGMSGASGAPGGAAGTGTAGAGTCDWSDPPSDVAAWIDESWSGQLGNNVKSRKAWVMDNVMMNQGSLSVCVRWGATSMVPDMVKTNLAATTERWFNDWFKSLGDYGCFPYGAGISVKVTGWAVKPGQQALLGDVGDLPVYTETDGDGEPKCPDACSSFVHWDHDFSDCDGGDANHSDYWLWFDDNLPGGGGAAAVGGDWGLRMPVSTFVNAFDRPSFLICEHEMGHGFGFQDYYDWTGSTPQGGSLMIVGSTSGQSPTTGDTWLLRRTWKEMKTLRGF